jgi:acyl-CoA oxidase
MEHGQLTAARGKLVTATVNALLKQLRPHMVTLVDAFGIPEHWKAARILEEEAGRQEAMAAEDAQIRRGTATSIEVAPAQ